MPDPGSGGAKPARLVGAVNLERLLYQLRRQGFTPPRVAAFEEDRAPAERHNLLALSQAVGDSGLLLAGSAVTWTEHTAETELVELAAHLEAGDEVGEDGQWRAAPAPAGFASQVARRVLAKVARRIAVRDL